MLHYMSMLESTRKLLQILPIQEKLLIKQPLMTMMMCTTFITCRSCDIRVVY
ncbi:hypothetical protein Hdeb2414_s0010g00336871 [Helianthus debilis subsp. tardiflorus]